MTAITTNVALPERIASVLGGAYLLYKAITEKKGDTAQTLAGTYLLLRGVTGFCAAYRVIGKTEPDFRTRNINVKTALTIHRPRHQVYAFWRRLENLPSFMKHLESVKILDEKVSEWSASIPGYPGTITWKSEIVKDDPGATLSWRSLPHSTIENSGKVTFQDAGKSGTEIHVVISYHAPLGILGEKSIRLLNPLFEKMLKEDITNFKSHIESSEIPTLKS
jgi:uncharacterized membrane protein